MGDAPSDGLLPMSRAAWGDLEVLQVVGYFAPQVTQANRGKAVGALAFVLLVLWLRRRRNRRSRTGDGVAVALDQQARNIVGDTVNALSAEVASTDRAQDKARKVRGRAARTQARAQVVEKAQRTSQPMGRATGGPGGPTRI